MRGQEESLSTHQNLPTVNCTTNLSGAPQILITHIKQNCDSSINLHNRHKNITSNSTPQHSLYKLQTLPLQAQYLIKTFSDCKQALSEVSFLETCFSPLKQPSYGDGGIKAAWNTLQVKIHLLKSGNDHNNVCNKCTPSPFSMSKILGNYYSDKFNLQPTLSQSNVPVHKVATLNMVLFNKETQTHMLHYHEQEYLSIEMHGSQKETPTKFFNIERASDIPV